jgi:hypothetical protein
MEVDETWQANVVLVDKMCRALRGPVRRRARRWLERSDRESRGSWKDGSWLKDVVDCYEDDSQA